MLKINAKPAVPSDCEGPLSKNDNAMEMTAKFVPDGGKLFENISKMDDAWADNFRLSGYNAGDTLKWVLPFQKAHGVTDKRMVEFSEQSLLMIRNSQETLDYIRKISNAFIITTSYEHYGKAICNLLKFPYENTYCTKVSLDKMPMTEQERDKVKEFGREIARMPLIEIPDGAVKMSDFAEKDRLLIERFNDIIMEKFQKMSFGKMLSEVVTVGGGQKAEAISDIVKKLDLSFEEVMYVGDSITDVEAFKLVHKNGGLAVSFNGNKYAVNNAQIAVLSDSNFVTAALAKLFVTYGTRDLLTMCSADAYPKNMWHEEFLGGPFNENDILKKFDSIFGDKLPKVVTITEENRKALADESSVFRKQVRGQAIGKLG